MVPLEQYGNHNQLSNDLRSSMRVAIFPQVGKDLWTDLSNKLIYDLLNECLIFTLKEELEHQCL